MSPADEIRDARCQQQGNADATRHEPKPSLPVQTAIALRVGEEHRDSHGDPIVITASNCAKRASRADSDDGFVFHKCVIPSDGPRSATEPATCDVPISPRFALRFGYRPAG